MLSSLTNRVFATSVLLVIISTGAAMYFVQRAVSARAEADLSTRLDEAVSLVDTVSRTQFADFIIKAKLIANLPVLRGAAATDDPTTAEPIAREYQQMLRADAFVVIGFSGRQVAQEGRVQLSPAAISELLRLCHERPDRTAFQPVEDGMLHVTVIPLDVGAGALLVGLQIDREAADAIKSLTDSDIAFLRGRTVVAATLPLGDVVELHPVAGRDNQFLVPVGGENYIGRQYTLDASGGPEAPTALVMRSRSELTRFLGQLRWQLVGTGALAVLVATLMGYVVARSVTRPLRALTGTMQAIAATGDLGRTPPEIGRWDDEDVRVVAATFRALTGALNRFQREASARERLSSLGRLSAVIAHEIRNPLMIIKSSARGLRRHPLPEVATAATSIDEEVGRVNRVVTGVLDFARPITFTTARADLGDICRAAIEAVLAGSDDVPIVLESAVADAPVDTDVERLRMVLVNLLNNAQQAIRAVPAGTRTSEPIRMHLAAARSGGWTISVEDRGPGIAPDDLTRVFDPFFTTRETGSGLGLALSRNIIDGLGGTIGVASQPGRGTTMTIELPGIRSGPKERT